MFWADGGKEMETLQLYGVSGWPPMLFTRSKNQEAWTKPTKRSPDPPSFPPHLSANAGILGLRSNRPPKSGGRLSLGGIEATEKFACGRFVGIFAVLLVFVPYCGDDSLLIWVFLQWLCVIGRLAGGNLCFCGC